MSTVPSYPPTLPTTQRLPAVGRQGRHLGIINSFKLDEKTGCWNWIGTKNAQGYGHSYWDGKVVKAHRLSAMLWLKFDIKSQLKVLHRCDNPSCINPKHLFVGTSLQNVADCISKGRHWWANKNSCINGHPFTEENTYHRGDKKGRECKVCSRDRVRRMRERRLDA